MREYKFRGKMIDNGEWVYGSLIDMGNHSQVFIFQYNDRASTLSCMSLIQSMTVAVDEETVGQATGLIDKNGVEVFENDIIEIPYNGLGRKVVKYLQDELKYNISGYKLSEIYVIGNIHDNKELLER